MTVSVEARHRRRSRADRDTAPRKGQPSAAHRGPHSSRREEGRERDGRAEAALAPDVPRSRDSGTSSPDTDRRPPTPDSEPRNGLPVDPVGIAADLERDRHAVALTLSVVIPARNEADNLAWVLARLPAFVDEVVVVDGGSTDGTADVARRTRPDVVVVADNGRGKGDAMRVGAAASRGSLIVMLDADGSMDPAELERFVEPLARGYEFVKGSRFLPGGGTTDMTPLRMVGNWGLNLVSNLLFRARWTDLCYGYCAFRRSALEDLALDADGFEIETQMVVRATRAGLRMVEVPSFEYPRRFGVSNLNTFRDGWRVLMTILRERLRPASPRLAVDRAGDV